MTRQGQLDYLTVQVARLKNGAKLSKDSLDMMLWTLEDLSAKEANKPQLPNFAEERQGQLWKLKQ
jgi:hypothetical protein